MRFPHERAEVGPLTVGLVRRTAMRGRQGTLGTRRSRTVMYTLMNERGHAVGWSMMRRATVVITLMVWVLLAMAGCARVAELRPGQVDYREASQDVGDLEVPPDLVELDRSRAMEIPGVASAAELDREAGRGAPSPRVDGVLPGPDGFEIGGEGSLRWLDVAAPPERLWPRLEQFWADQGLVVQRADPRVGVIETDWAENLASTPNIGIPLVGRLLENLYSTNTRDRYRMRMERHANGSRIYIAHVGVEEVVGIEEGATGIWERRPSEPLLEAEMLTRMMVFLGLERGLAEDKMADEDVRPDPTGSAVVIDSGMATVSVQRPFDEVWQRVGLALDRYGLRIIEADRDGGSYLVEVDGSVAPPTRGIFDRDVIPRSLLNTRTGTGQMRVTVRPPGPDDDADGAGVLVIADVASAKEADGESAAPLHRQAPQRLASALAQALQGAAETGSATVKTSS